MKLLALCIGLVLVGSNASAAATTSKQILTKVELNGQVVPGQIGLLTLDLDNRRMEVEVMNDICHSFTAAPGTITCLAMPILVSNFSVPLLKESNSCGSLVYEGSEDLSPMDGLKTTIRVTDHSTRYCEDIVPSMIVVEATVFNPWTQQTAAYVLTK